MQRENMSAFGDLVCPNPLCKQNKQIKYDRKNYRLECTFCHCILPNQMVDLNPQADFKDEDGQYKNTNYCFEHKDPIFDSIEYLGEEIPNEMDIKNNVIKHIHQILRKAPESYARSAETLFYQICKNYSTDSLTKLKMEKIAGSALFFVFRQESYHEENVIFEKISKKFCSLSSITPTKLKSFISKLEKNYFSKYSSSIAEQIKVPFSKNVTKVATRMDLSSEMIDSIKNIWQIIRNNNLYSGQLENTLISGVICAAYAKQNGHTIPISFKKQLVQHTQISLSTLDSYLKKFIKPNLSLFD